MSHRFLLLLVMSVQVYTAAAWNMQGHHIVAQIAYDHLTPEAREFCAQNLGLRKSSGLESRFVYSASWLDSIRFRSIHWYDAYHYIDLPFSEDNTPLPALETTNAVAAINQALKILRHQLPKKDEKKLALKMLIHVVGDIHQPLHAANRVSTEHPTGDLGGNLFPLGANAIGTNLHQYWDNGGGYFRGFKKLGAIKKRAREIESKWPCGQVDISTAPSNWARVAHELAVSRVYSIKPNQSPNFAYQQMAVNISQKQTASAGCRLAALLNDLSVPSLAY